MSAHRRRTRATMTPPRQKTARAWWPAAAIAGIGAIVYINSLSVPFVLDDIASIVDNRGIRAWSLAGAFARGQASAVAGRPIVQWSFALNYALGALDVRGYHAVNLAVHLACALLLFGIIRRTLDGPGMPSGLQQSSSALAFAAALIWTVHPLNSEVVDYVVQRTESLMALCYLLTLYAAIRSNDDGRSGRWQALAVVACAAGMACKESMATAPLTVVLYDRAFRFDSMGRALRARWRLYGGLAATFVLLAAAIRFAPRAEVAGFSTGIDPWTYLLNQAVVITGYLKLVWWPHALVAFYGWPAPLTLTAAWPYVALMLVLVAATITAWIYSPPLGFLGAWFFITLAPASSIVPVATEVGAERRMYLPLAAIAVLVVIAAAELLRLIDPPLVSRHAVEGGPTAARPRLQAMALLGIVTLALAARTIVRNREYATPVSLARTIVERRPSGVAHQMLGEQLMVDGQHDEAIRELLAAVPDDSMARYPLGLELFSQRRYDESIQQLDAFVHTWGLPYRLVPHWLEPSDSQAVTARTVMARAYAASGRWPAAIDQARAAQAIDRNNADAQGLLADAWFSERRFDEAVPAYRRYLELRPSDVNAWTRLGMALAASDRSADALAAFRRAVDANPASGEAQRNLALALFDTQDSEGALSHAREAVRLRPDDPVAHDVYGRTLAVLGQLDRAAGEIERAIQLDPNDAQAREDRLRIAQLRSRPAATSSRRPTPGRGE